MPKTSNPVAADVGLGDRVNMLFAGTVVTYGRGRAVVVSTGMNTEVGRIAGLLEAAEKEPTPLQQELDRTGKRLTVVMLGICVVVFAAGLFSTSTLTLNVVLSLFLFAVALAVAAILGGAARNRDRRVSVSACAEWRQPTPSCETAGHRNAGCGNGDLLGQDRHLDPRVEMTVRAIVTGDALIEVGGSGYIPEGEFSKDGKPIVEASPLRNGLERTLQAAALVNDSELTYSDERWRLHGDPTEGALVVAARKFGLKAQESGALCPDRRDPIHIRTQTTHHRSR